MGRHRDGKMANIHFYWVQSSSAVTPPECPSDAVFWQRIFDEYASHDKNPNRQKRSQANDAEEQQTKKQKAKTTPREALELTQEQVNENLEYLSKQLEQSREDANAEVGREEGVRQELAPEDKEQMLRHAWCHVYPNIPFPDELLTTSNNNAHDNKEQKLPKKSGRYYVRDVQLANGDILHDVPSNYHIVPDGEMGKFEKAREIVRAMKRAFAQGQASATIYSQYLHGAYASAFPSMPSEQQAVLIALA